MTRLRSLVCTLAAAAALSGCTTDPEVAKRQFVQSGDRFAAAGQHGEAIVQYRNAIQQDERFAEARTKLAASYLQVGDVGNAYRHYIRAADLLPDDASAQIKAAEMLLASRRFEDTRTRADRALAIDPRLVEAQLLRAYALAGMNRLDDAVSEVEQAIAADPERSSTYASLGAMQLVRGNRQEAEAAFLKAVELNDRSAAAHLALGSFYWAAGDRDRAQAQLAAAIAADPKNVLANRAMAYLLLGTGRASDAEPYLRAVANLLPDGSGQLALASYYAAHQRLADAHRVFTDVAARDDAMGDTARLRLAALGLGTGDVESATRLVDQVLARQPAHAEALVVRAQLLVRAGRMDEALVAARAAVAAKPESPQTRLALGRVFMARREETDAASALAEALKLNPRLAPAQVEMARLHLAAGRIDEAEQFARGAITEIAGYAEAHFLLARISLVRGKPTQAEPSLRALERAFPQSAAVQTEVGLLELSRKRPREARAAFDRALTIDATFVGALGNLVLMDLQSNQPAAARARMAAALDARPADARVLLLAARTHVALRDPDAAERCLRAAIDADPADLDAYVALAQLYAGQGRLPAAAAQFEQLARERRGSVAAQTIAGMFFQMQQRTAEARTAFERALAIDARAAVAANNLAWIHAESGENLDLALQLAHTAKLHLPNRPEINDTLGWVYYRKGLMTLAIPPLVDAAERDPTSATYQYHLGLVYAATARAQQARAALQKALVLDPNFAGAADARRALARIPG